MHRYIMAAAVAAWLGACGGRTAVPPPPATTTIAPDAIPLLPFEPPVLGAESMNTEYYQGSAEAEAAAFAELARQIQELQTEQTRARGQEVQRGFHAKAHGCLHGWFRLFPDRDPRTRFGVFADGRGPWPVWVRFSNGVGWREGDDELDARGMAVKLMGVPGDKLVADESGTQDFLMTNSPTPVGRDAHQFMRFAHANARSRLHNTLFAMRHPRTAAPALLDTFPVPSVVATQYWSGGAFHLGAHQAVKFTAKPCSVARARAPGGQGRDRLRQDLAQAARAGFCFTFYVQFQSDPWRTPIEDASRAWSEDDAPLVPVGTIDFPSQDILDERRAQFCQQLSFNPWHAIAAHQPMGHINRARRYVYEASRAFRKGGLEPRDFSVR